MNAEACERSVIFDGDNENTSGKRLEEVNSAEGGNAVKISGEFEIGINAVYKADK